MLSWDFLALQPALPEVFLALSTMVLLMLGVFRGDGHTRILSRFAMLVLGLTLLLVELDDIGGPWAATPAASSACAFQPTNASSH